MLNNEKFFIDYNMSPYRQVSPLHDHSANEIIFVVDGEADFIINNSSYKLQKNYIIFISSNEKHELVSSNEFYKRYYLLIENSMLNTSLFNESLTAPFIYRPKDFCHAIKIPDEYANQIIQLLQQMYSEFQINAPYKLNRLQLMLYDLLILLFRARADIFQNYENNSYASLIIKVQQYINANFKNNITLQEIANRFYTNMSYLSTKFKETVGCTFKQYLTDLRISYAKDLLTMTEIPISNIPYLCGFNDITNFSRKFKQIVGCSPLVYRKHPSPSEYDSY